MLPDGRTRVASALPRGDVWLSVTSPDADLADELFGGARLPDRVNGCPIQPAEPFTDAPPEMFQTGATTRGGVCGYRDGWLVGATWLNPRRRPAALRADRGGAERGDRGLLRRPYSPGRAPAGGSRSPGSALYFDGSHACPTFTGSDAPAPR